MPTASCAECATTFNYKNEKRPARYCSDRCRSMRLNRASKEATERKRASTTPTCQHDGCDVTLAWPTRGMPPAMCAEHTRELKAARQRAYMASYEPPTDAEPCQDEECTAPAYCRQMCRKHYRRWARANGLAKSPSDAWTDKRKAHSLKRKAVKRGATSAIAFDNLAIFKRDSWTCGICSEPVDKTLTHPHPMSASLDHIVPLAHGGAHAPQNAQCSHLRCNLIKGDRVASLTA